MFDHRFFMCLLLTLRIAAAVKADQVFLPVLENASKAEKLRTTLGVFERSKFFFNLPGFLVESIEAVRHRFMPLLSRIEDVF
jgi:hypothetical protein